MFVRKLFKIGNKGRWLLLELIIVFIGVYLAFLFQSYGETRKEEKERQRIFAALKTELEFFRVVLPGRSGYTRNRWRELQQFGQRGEYTDFSDWRFLEPQYTYQVIEYAINHQNSDIIDFDIFQRLQSLHTDIKRLEHAERLMMEMAQRYKMIPANLPKNDPIAISLNAENTQNFKRFLVFLRDRAQDQAIVARGSVSCLQLIDPRMDPDRRKEMERDLIMAEIDIVDSADEAVEIVKELFPNFTEEEVRELYRQANDQ